jgi:hypothetical protein
MYYTLAVDELVDITFTALVCTFVCSITSDFEGIQTLLFYFQKCNMGTALRCGQLLIVCLLRLAVKLCGVFSL